MHPEVEMIQDFEGQQLQTQWKEFFKRCFRVVIHPSLGMEAAGWRSERSRWRRKNEHETWKCGWKSIKVHKNLPGGGFKQFFFSPLFGEDSHFDSYFSNGWFNHHLVCTHPSPTRCHHRRYQLQEATKGLGLWLGCACCFAQAGDARKCTWHRIESWNSTWVPWTNLGRMDGLDGLDGSRFAWRCWMICC